MEALLQLEGIAKKYGRRTVFRDVTLALYPGECVALTGENGCGKSTLLRIACGLTRADAGRVVRLADACLQYVPDAFPPLPVSARRFLRAVVKEDGDVAPRLETLGVAADMSMRNYSKGMLAKVNLAQAFAAEGRLFLLDEPVSGLDADARDAFVCEVRKRCAGGAAVLLACHERELVSDVADRVLRMANGTIAAADAASAACLCGQCARRRAGLCPGGGDCDA